MKASELIRALQEAKKRYGDLPVTTHEWGMGRFEVREVHVWTAHGGIPDLRKRRTDPPVEIQIF